MIFDVEGKIIKIMSEQSGEGKNGRWTRQDFILETREQYPKKMCLAAWGDKSDQLKGYKPGDDLKVSFIPESREFNERWYTDMKVFKMERLGTAAKTANTNTTEVNTTSVTPDDFTQNNNDSDLPF